MPKSIGFWRTTYVTWTQSFVSVCLAVSEKTGEQTDKQTNKQTNKQTREPLAKGDSCKRISIKKSFSHIITKFTTKKKYLHGVHITHVMSQVFSQKMCGFDNY